MFRFLISLLMIAWLIPTASAHEFWISPAQGVVDPGQPIVADLRLGSNMKGQQHPYLSDRYEKFKHYVRGTTTDVTGLQGDIPAINLDAAAEGLHVITNETVPMILKFQDWNIFLKYLGLEGYEQLAALHDKRGIPHEGFEERYTRNIKALVQAGPISADDHDFNTGMPLEIVADGNPYAAGATSVAIILTWKGAPLGNRRVNIFQDNGQVIETHASTDANGKLTIPLNGPGEYLFSSVYLREANENTIVWQSNWATLSFKLK